MAKSAISTSNLYPLPTPRPGYRFAPAKVGRSEATSIIALIECPVWCAEDHVDEPQRAVEDIMHTSRPAHVSTTSFLQRGTVSELYASVQADPVADDPRLKAAHVVVDDGGNENAYLTPEMAEGLADEMIGFASELRHLARIARLAHSTTGDSDPDMDEALRRVREGGVA
jgi:hypothetical protein